MKTRENELHEPIIEVKTNKTENSATYTIKCSDCGRALKRVWSGLHEEHEKYKTILLQETLDYITYCPNCGARLKEI